MPLQFTRSQGEIMNTKSILCLPLIALPAMPM